MPSSFAAAVRLKRVFVQRLQDRLALDLVQVVLAAATARAGAPRAPRRRRSARASCRSSRLDVVRPRQRDRALEDVLELAHVAGEVVRAQRLERASADSRRGAAPPCRARRARIASAISGMSSPAFAQRRHPQLDHVEAVEEVLAELARLDQRARGPGAWRR